MDSVRALSGCYNARMAALIAVINAGYIAELVAALVLTGIGITASLAYSYFGNSPE